MKALTPQGQLTGLQMGAKAETDWKAVCRESNGYGSGAGLDVRSDRFLAMVRAPWYHHAVLQDRLLAGFALGFGWGSEIGEGVAIGCRSLDEPMYHMKNLHLLIAILFPHHKIYYSAFYLSVHKVS